MSVLGGLLVVLLLLPAWVLLQTLLLRLAVRLVGDVRLGFGRALVTVIVAGLVQEIATGGLSLLVLGGDGGLCGTIAGFLVWSAITSAMTDLTFRRALVVGLVMAVLWWILGTAVKLLLFALGIGALAIGNVKYRTESGLFKQMTESKTALSLDFRQAFELARALA